jgi:hypothetical protein
MVGFVIKLVIEKILNRLRSSLDDDRSFIARPCVLAVYQQTFDVDNITTPYSRLASASRGRPRCTPPLAVVVGWVKHSHNHDTREELSAAAQQAGLLCGQITERARGKWSGDTATRQCGQARRPEKQTQSEAYHCESILRMARRTGVDVAWRRLVTRTSVRHDLLFAVNRSQCRASDRRIA